MGQSLYLERVTGMWNPVMSVHRCQWISPSNPSVVQRTFAATNPSYGLVTTRFIDKQAAGGEPTRVF